ncbi:hypothetical protein [Photobacterium kishitanii]|uniref:hypothetical protein n=1 Tax=Photobacterium kishitanii TaxID=318456 RepID=UPI00071AEF86|nr:hypothetical protein [Photobacterium kishitanii]
MRSSIDQYDSSDWPSITDHYIGIIGEMPLYSTTEPTANSCTTNNNTIYIVDGHNLSGLNIKRNKDYASIKIDNMNGHPKFNAGEGVIDWLTFEKESGKAVTMQMHMFGKLHRCDVDEEWYKVDVCS